MGNDSVKDKYEVEFLELVKLAPPEKLAKLAREKRRAIIVAVEWAFNQSCSA